MSSRIALQTQGDTIKNTARLLFSVQRECGPQSGMLIRTFPAAWILRELFNCPWFIGIWAQGLQGLGFLKLTFDSNLRPGREGMKEPRWSSPGLSYVCVMLAEHEDQEGSCWMNQSLREGMALEADFPVHCGT